MWDEGREKEHNPCPYSPSILSDAVGQLLIQGVLPKASVQADIPVMSGLAKSARFSVALVSPLTTHSHTLWCDRVWEGGGGGLPAPSWAVPTCLSPGCFKESDLDGRLVCHLSSYAPIFEMRR